MSPLTRALTLLVDGSDLTVEQASAAFGAIIEGDVPEGLITAFLTALRVRGESAAALSGAVAAVRQRMELLRRCDSTPLLDTCGTGGDGAGTLNVSTTAALLAAACGVPVAKHGNRSASGNSGSSEVLAELGLVIEADGPVVERCLAELGITFLYASRYHPFMRFAAPARKLLPFRTLFNLVGPLVNPARPEFQLVGVPSAPLADLVAAVLAGFGTRRAAVVTGCDGLDEVTLSGPTRVLLVEEGRVTPQPDWTPDDFGLPIVSPRDLQVAGPVESAQRLRLILAGEPDPARHVILANTAAALWVTGRAADLREGVALSTDALDSGAATRLLERWVRLSQAAGREPTG